MNDAEKQKIQRFIEDPIMSGAVRSILEAECLKPSKDRDVQNLAAKMIAIEIIQSGFNELLKYKTDEQNKSGLSGKQVGL
jgi:hypothetical protein